MNTYVVICFLAVLGLSYARPEYYTTKYDNINLKEILENPRLLEGYMKCVLDKGNCTPEGKELKSHIQEGLENDCAKCTEAQKKGVDETLIHIVNKEPEYWQQLCEKFDPAGKYRTTLEKRYRQAA